MGKPGTVPPGAMLLWPRFSPIPEGWETYPMRGNEDWWARLWEVTVKTDPPIVIKKI